MATSTTFAESAVFSRFWCSLVSGILFISRSDLGACFSPTPLSAAAFLDELLQLCFVLRGCCTFLVVMCGYWPLDCQSFSCLFCFVIIAFLSVSVSLMLVFPPVSKDVIYDA